MVPRNGPALEYIKARCAEQPQYYVDQIRPPSYLEPPLVDEEKSFVEKKQGEFNEGEGRTSEDHDDPHMLERVRKVSRVVGIRGIYSPRVKTETISRRLQQIPNNQVDTYGGEKYEIVLNKDARQSKGCVAVV
ncbi:MAG: hypothetical protein M1821_008819 [Bathelium mastoideum]|nr:MAG: hypothetical protein M1821_008819 [Bathelium mastoideum]